MSTRPAPASDQAAPHGTELAGPVGAKPTRVVPPREKTPTRDAPARPALTDKAGMPVIVKKAPPFTVGLAVVLWVMSLVAGAASVVYLFIIRTSQLPLIQDMIRSIDDTRPDATVDLAADIVYWSLFGGMVLVVFLQIVFLVSFSNRRPGARWWIFGSLIMLGVLFLLGRELVTMGDKGVPLERLQLAELALLALGLLISVLPGALRWTARRHDVRRGPEGPIGGGL